MIQGELFKAERSTFARFKEFHEANPEVYQLFRKFAVEAAAVRKRFGARMIGERIRWYTQVETTEKIYKVNDHYWPYYARLLAIKEPSFRDFFEWRGGGADALDSELARL